VIDLSADYRLRNAADYVEWYKAAHLDPDGLVHAVYGLPELHRKSIIGASLVATPGCYPVGAILATAPLVKGGLARLDGIVIDGKSGVSGAGAQGRKVDPMYLYTEANENVQAYGLGFHRHTAEMEQELSLLAGEADTRTNRAVCVSAIDNLGKGGSANGIQNLNVMHGWSERTGLAAPPVYP
jgi:N-acetyl-gamma-glutamyl-phosphate reductase